MAPRVLAEVGDGHGQVDSRAGREIEPGRGVEAGVQLAQLRLPDLRIDVAVLTVVGDDCLRVFTELVDVINPRPLHEGQQAGRPVGFHGTCQQLVADVPVAEEFDVANRDARPFLDGKGDVHQLRAAGDGLELRLHLGVLIALLGIQFADALEDTRRLFDRLVEQRRQRCARVLHVNIDIATPQCLIADQGAAKIESPDDRALGLLLDGLREKFAKELGSPIIMIDLVIGFTAMTSRASISSFTRMAPISAVNPAPTCAARVTPAKQA